jgi:uncharacterized protein YndB with AHSA1/START domain
MESVEEVRKSIVVDAPAESVFKALTDEKELVQWMPTEAKMDARVGGVYEFKYHWAARNLDTVLRGKILEMVLNERLSLTWDSEAMGGEKRITHAVVTWILTPLADGKTNVTLIHSEVGKTFLDDTEKGWNYYLGRLDALLKKK